MSDTEQNIVADAAKVSEKMAQGGECLVWQSGERVWVVVVGVLKMGVHWHRGVGVYAVCNPCAGGPLFYARGFDFAD